MTIRAPRQGKFIASGIYHTSVSMKRRPRNRRPRTPVAGLRHFKGRIMAAYLLVPLHTSEWIWTLATWRGPVQVIAGSEQDARKEASLRFGLPSRGGQPGCADDPWLHSKWTYVHPIDELHRDIPVLE